MSASRGTTGDSEGSPCPAARTLLPCPFERHDVGTPPPGHAAARGQMDSLPSAPALQPCHDQAVAPARLANGTALVWFSSQRTSALAHRNQIAHRLQGWVSNP